MNSENKNCAEILLGMMKTAWVNFDRRRSYEWKLSFGIWTALAVLIGYAARGDLKLSSEPWEILLFLGGICLFQLFFLHRTHLGNIVDEERAHAYEETLHKIILRDLRDSDIELNLEKVDNARDGVTGISRLGGWCGIIVHLAITFLLVVAVLIVTRKVPKEWPGLLVSIALLAIFVILVRLFHRELKSIPKGVRLSAKSLLSHHKLNSFNWIQF